MRQVPKYIVVGNGRMAQHCCHYFNGLSIEYRHWARSIHSPEQLQTLLIDATHVLLLITDNEIDSFIQNHLFRHTNLTLVHFSGCLVTNLAHSAHPLQSFVKGEQYTLNEYQAVPFILSSEGPEFNELLPGLTNPHYRIGNQDKAYYHSMCVLANNFSTLLWQKFFTEMQNRFDINKQDLLPFLEKTFSNIKQNTEFALTGPLARKDTQTLGANLASLQGDPFQSIFNAFVEAFVKEPYHEVST